jgi:hypothetical protein
MSKKTYRMYFNLGNVLYSGMYDLVPTDKLVLGISDTHTAAVLRVKVAREKNRTDSTKLHT